MNTIAAISTAPGVGGIAVIRVSGPDAITFSTSVFRSKRSLKEFESHTVHYGTITAADGSDIDDCVVTVFKAPHSFTGEDTVEIACHGSQYIQQSILKALLNVGCRMAEPGEFTALVGNASDNLTLKSKFILK